MLSGHAIMLVSELEQATDPALSTPQAKMVAQLRKDFLDFLRRRVHFTK
ncbi:hypothetical protein KIPB_014201, partial [Kipferlia bialata]|eukprot:g14201.t1